MVLQPDVLLDRLDRPKPRDRYPWAFGSLSLGFKIAIPGRHIYDPAMEAWNGWYHVNGHTYGSWLRGDPRGWRARHHREHVEGDYKNPPPEGAYSALYGRSKQLQKRPSIRLSVEARRLACSSMEESLQDHGAEVVVLCVDDHHYHILVRFPKSGDGNPWACAAPKRKDRNESMAIARHFIGIAKKHSAIVLSKAHLVAPGGVWATRAQCQPIRDRAHQLNVYRYIVAHKDAGAAVWTFSQQ